MRDRTKKTAFLGVLTAAALLLSYVESLFVLAPGIPGIKLGLANLAVVLCLYRYGWREAAALNLVRILLSSLLFGSFFTMAYSLAGAALSFGAMLAGVGAFFSAGRQRAGRRIPQSGTGSGGDGAAWDGVGRLVCAVAFSCGLRDGHFYRRVRKGGKPLPAHPAVEQGAKRTGTAFPKKEREKL